MADEQALPLAGKAAERVAPPPPLPRLELVFACHRGSLSHHNSSAYRCLVCLPPIVDGRPGWHFHACVACIPYALSRPLPRRRPERRPVVAPASRYPAADVRFEVGEQLVPGVGAGAERARDRLHTAVPSNPAVRSIGALARQVVFLDEVGDERE